MERFRRRRIQFFCSAFPPSACRTVLDVGGTPQIWRMLGTPYEVPLLNEDPQELKTGNNRRVIGDGRNLQFPDKSFDVAFSNSGIEHVGNWEDMQRFASELRRVGNSFYCQTPNKWFPVEPHLGRLFLHWWPRLLNFYFLTRYFTAEQTEPSASEKIYSKYPPAYPSRSGTSLPGSDDRHGTLSSPFEVLRQHGQNRQMFVTIWA
jgi:hypothetical protein